MAIQFQTVPPNGMDFLIKILALDWTPVSHCLKHQGFTIEKIKAAIGQYSCFLTLTYIYPGALIPSQTIDAVHHAFLESSRYEQDMKSLNHVVDHVPYAKEAYFDYPSLLQRFSYTKSLFKATFGFAMLERESDTLQVGGCYLKKAHQFERPHKKLS